MMRTWPYGTKRKAKVVDASTHSVYGKDVLVLLLKDENDEGHALVGTNVEAFAAGTEGTITFTQGGPFGGYWKFEKVEAMP